RDLVGAGVESGDIDEIDLVVDRIKLDLRNEIVHIRVENDGAEGRTGRRRVQGLHQRAHENIVADSPAAARIENEIFLLVGVELDTGRVMEVGVEEVKRRAVDAGGGAVVVDMDDLILAPNGGPDFRHGCGREYPLETGQCRGRERRDRTVCARRGTGG